jgi:uncharacterized protein YukE
MNETELALWQQAIERVLQALEELERAIDEQNDTRIEARTFELRQTLKALEALTQEQKP